MRKSIVRCCDSISELRRLISSLAVSFLTVVALIASACSRNSVYSCMIRVLSSSWYMSASCPMDILEPHR